MGEAECVHLWVRRRDGSWCSHCGQTRFGVSLSEEERQRLRTLRGVEGEVVDVIHVTEVGEWPKED